MGERMNGKGVQFRRRHGSERRGVTPVPDLNFAYQQRQSMQDKRRMQQLLTEHKERVIEITPDRGLGNRDLPAYKHKNELVANIEAHKAVIVGGETGSGKSTQLPQFLYEAGYDLTLVLVPRRVIADGLHARIGEEMAQRIQDFDADEVVGLRHGERTVAHENNKILIMTPNTFIKMETDLRARYGDKKVAVIADEIHEANLFTEIAVGVAAMSVGQHEDWRLIAASATHNAATLQKPFQRLNGGYVPSVEINGRPFEVELSEEPDLTPMQAYARDGANHPKAMLFTSGKEEIKYAIEQTILELEKREKGSSEKIEFRVLHGELTEFELSHINDPVPEGYRLVIVSSPAGMSGITIPGVTYVATDGTINRNELDEDGAEGLKRQYLSKAGIKQQIGRAGRDVPGGVGKLCAPIMSRGNKKTEGVVPSTPQNQARMPYMPHYERDEHEPPEIYNTNLSRVVLSVAANNYQFAALNDYIPHPVKQSNIISAEEALARLGALDDDDRITAVGRGMDVFPVRPELARGLFEAQGPNRNLQHMARAAFIAAAIDVGGIEDHKADDSVVRVRRQIIRHTSKDDLMAQLDLMTKLYERTSEDWSGYEFVQRHGLHPKRVERVRKTTRKILEAMNVRPQNIIVTAPTPSEEQQLRNDFTAGFIDYVFEDVGKKPRSSKVLYRNIHGSENNNSTKRTISDRSHARVGRGELVAGIPRYYLKGTRKSGEDIKHDIIDHVFKVDPHVVGEYALQNGLVQGMWKESRMDGDQAVDYEQGIFGSIFVGAPKKCCQVEVLSEEAQAVLVEHVLSNPGRVQQALRQLADDLEGYRTRTPAEVLKQLRIPGAPSDISQEGVTEMIRAAARTEVSAHGVEEKLASNLYHMNISLSRYYDVDSLRELNEMSPQRLVVGHDEVAVHYEDGQPYITKLLKRQLSQVTGPIYLEDGREVLYQREARGGGTERVSFGAL